MLTALKPEQGTLDIVAGLKGRWHGSYAMCICPAHAYGRASLSIRQGQQGILVHCFAGCRNEDVLRTIARTRPIPNSPAPALQNHPGAANAARLWDKASAIERTLAEEYLRYREIDGNAAGLRYLHACPFGRKPDTVFRPAILVPVRTGIKLVAIQRIALGPKGRSHKGKYMLGRPGEGAWSPDFKGSVLALAESMEDAAAYAKLKGIPCWSSLGAERLPLVRIPDRVSTLIIAEDNNRAGRLGALAAIEALTTDTRTVTRDPPPRGFTDWAEFNEHRGG
jgi:hypothetical protein